MKAARDRVVAGGLPRAPAPGGRPACRRPLGLIDAVSRGHGPLDHRPRPFRWVALLIWAAFIVFPMVDAATSQVTGLRYWFGIAGAVVFAFGYAMLVVLLFRPDRSTARIVLTGLLLALAVALTVFDRSGLGYLVTYVAACAAAALPVYWRFPSVLVCTALAVGCVLLLGGSDAGSAAIGYGSSTVGVGLLMVLLTDLRERNTELTKARAELARVAVAHERERFARDLHDLLGHSLTVIAIKAELAGRLLGERVDDAAAEVADVEQVARQALREVREAVSGYRQPTLERELEGARVALAAAGIEAEIERAAPDLEPEVEALLAWTVREGATNVIRHSGARRCRVNVSSGLAGAIAEVIDDGPNAPQRNGASGPGHGIAGLAERAERVHGRIEAGRIAGDGGFRLAVSVPVGWEGA
ncbi:MAG: sensor histidine kinase [Solirubrobacteraceae bacterium]